MRARIVIVLAALLFVWLAPSDAHHSISGVYHRNRTITVEGTVQRFIFRDPHIFIYLNVRDEADALEAWTLEGDDASDMAEVGFTPETLRSGDEIVVTGYPARDGSNSVFIRKLHRPVDGLEYFDD